MINTHDLELIETKGRFDRFQIGPEECVWICSDCGEEGDPWEKTCGGCEDLRSDMEEAWAWEDEA